MLHDKLWEIAGRIDWRLMIVASFSALVVATGLMCNGIRIGKRIQTIETQLSNMQREISAILQIQVALMTKLSAKSRAEIDPRDRAVETGGGDVAGAMMSTPTTLAQPESTKSAKLPE